MLFQPSLSNQVKQIKLEDQDKKFGPIKLFWNKTKWPIARAL